MSTWATLFGVSEASAPHPDTSYSHPDAAVRHSYPLAVQSAGVGSAISLLFKTLPYALIRFTILMVVSIALIVWTILALWGAVAVANRAGALPAWILLAVMLGPAGWFWAVVLRYGLALIKYGHVAVLTDLITQGHVGNGDEHMFSYGKRRVIEQFGQVNLLLALGGIVHGVVRAFNRTLDWVTRLVPIPGLSSVASFAKATLHAATTYVDETIFSYNLARGDDNPWRSSKDGIVYYAQNCKEVLKTSMWVVVLDAVASVAVWVVMLVPAYLVAIAFPGAGWTFIIALVIAFLFARSFRAAFIKPTFLIMVMTKFHASVRGQAINAEWDQRLARVSDKFQALTARAREAFTSEPVATPAAAAPAPALQYAPQPHASPAYPLPQAPTQSSEVYPQPHASPVYPAPASVAPHASPAYPPPHATSDGSPDPASTRAHLQHAPLPPRVAPAASGAKTILGYAEPVVPRDKPSSKN